MNIFICDDEPQMLSVLSETVKNCLQGENIRSFSSGRQLLSALERENCDILFLDIDMPEITGLEVAKGLLGNKEKPLLIFVTSHDELVYDSFAYHPFGFIRKSCFSEEIEGVLFDCAAEIESRREHFCFRTEGKKIRILLSQIWYFEAEGNYLKIYLKDREYRFRSTVTAVENHLKGKGFIRVHKGFLVNQLFVHILHGKEVELRDGKKIPIGKSYEEDAKKQFMRYMR